MAATAGLQLVQFASILHKCITKERTGSDRRVPRAIPILWEHGAGGPHYHVACDGLRCGGRPEAAEGSQVRPMTQAASSNQSIGRGPRVRGGSVPATAGASSASAAAPSGLRLGVADRGGRAAPRRRRPDRAVRGDRRLPHALPRPRTKFGTLELYGGMLALVLTTNILQLAGLYQFNQLTNLFGQSGRLLLAWAAVMLSLLALGFMTKATASSTPRGCGSACGSSTASSGCSPPGCCSSTRSSAGKRAAA